MKKVTYEEKIDRILDNRLEFNGDSEKVIADIQTWLCCEWQSGMIEDMQEYTRLKKEVVEIANKKIKEL